MMNDQITRSSPRGVTLVEVLVTLVIIAVLMAIIAPIYINTVDGAYRVKCANQLQTLGRAVLAYESEHGVLPGPLDSHVKLTLSARLSRAGYLVDEDLWTCPSNRGVERESVIAKKSNYAAHNTSSTLPPYFFGQKNHSEPLSLNRILAQNPDGIWLLRDHDVSDTTFAYEPGDSPGMTSERKPPHAKGRNYFFADGRVKHIKFGAFPSE